MNRGEIYWADLVPRSGSEQTGRRPVIVISDDGFNQSPLWRSVIIVPLSTSKTQAGRGPTAVMISAQATGLTRDSVAICHQITTLDRAKLAKRIGVLPAKELAAIEDGLRAALDME